MACLLLMFIDLNGIASLDNGFNIQTPVTA